MSGETLTIIIAVIGATTGLISLGWQAWSSRFRLVFERTILRYEREVVQQFRDRPADQLAESFFEFQLEIELLNIASGRGSIEKPRLEIRRTNGTSIIQYPDTEEHRREAIPGRTGAVRTWTERLGNSYSIAPRERLDDVLAYMFEFKSGDQFQAFLQEFRDLRFELVYRDHRGRERHQPIQEVVGVVDEVS